MTGHLSISRPCENLAASLVVLPKDNSILSSIEQYTQIIYDISQTHDFREWIKVKEHQDLVLSLLRVVNKYKQSWYISFFFSEVSYDVLVYLLHIAIVALHNDRFELKPEMVDSAYKLVKPDIVLHYMNSQDSLELFSDIMEGLAIALEKYPETNRIEQILKDSDWRTKMHQVVHSNLSTYVPILLGHTLHILQIQKSQGVDISYITSLQTLKDELSNSLKMAKSDILYVPPSTEHETYITISSTLCNVFAYCLSSIVENADESEANYLKEVVGLMFSIIGLDNIKGFVSSNFYTKIEKSFEKFRDKN